MTGMPVQERRLALQSSPDGAQPILALGGDMRWTRSASCSSRSVGVRSVTGSIVPNKQVMGPRAYRDLLVEQVRSVRGARIGLGCP